MKTFQKCIKTFKNNTFDLVFTVSAQDRAVLKSGFGRGNKFVPVAEPDFTFMNRQDLPELFRPNGAVYVFNGGWFEENNGFTSNKIGVVEMQKENSLDIDNQEDFDRSMGFKFTNANHIQRINLYILDTEKARMIFHLELCVHSHCPIFFLICFSNLSFKFEVISLGVEGSSKINQTLNQNCMSHHLFTFHYIIR